MVHLRLPVSPIPNVPIKAAAFNADCGMILQQNVIGMDENPIQYISDISNLSTKTCSLMNKPLPSSRRAKRKADPASVLEVSCKMSTTLLGLEDEEADSEDDADSIPSSSQRPTKRTKIMENVSQMVKSISTFEALTKALEGVNTSRKEDDLFPKQGRRHPHLKDSPRFSLGLDKNKNEDEFTVKSLNVSAWQNDHFHRACELFPNNRDFIKIALECDPEATHRRSTKRTATGNYSLPINIALKNKAKVGTLELLVKSDPSVLTYKDGPDGSASLSIALLKGACDFEIAHLLLQANPKCIKVVDRRLNFPLHVACSCSGASFELICYLYKCYPEVCKLKNFHGETPLDIAKRNPKCSSKIVNFLQRVSAA